MANLVIEDQELAQRLRDIAAQEHRPVEDVLRSMIDKYDAQPNNDKSEIIQSMVDTFDKRAAETSPLEALIGLFDDVDATDLSMKATGHLGEYFVKKHDDPD